MISTVQVVRKTKESTLNRRHSPMTLMINIHRTPVLRTQPMTDPLEFDRKNAIRVFLPHFSLIQPIFENRLPTFIKKVVILCECGTEPGSDYWRFYCGFWYRKTLFGGWVYEFDIDWFLRDGPWLDGSTAVDRLRWYISENNSLHKNVVIAHEHV